MTTYTDTAGNRYTALGKMPYCELLPGTPYAFEGEGEVHFKGTSDRRPTGEAWLDRLTTGLRNRLVLVLERVEGEVS